MDLDQAATAAFASGHLSGILPSSLSVARVVKALIAASEEKIAQIDSQIRDLQHMRAREYGLITSLKLVISPIRKLPDELLATIFDDAVCTLQSAVRLSHVCKHWRLLAHRTPALWTPPLPPRLLKRTSQSVQYIQITKAYLERSMPHPISLCLNCTSRDVKIPSALADVLLVGASRWVYLEVQDHPSVLQALAKLRPDALKMLRTVALRGDSVTETAAVTVFLCAPLLREVTLQVANTTKFPMPWAQLTELDLWEDSFPIWLNILLQCTNLVHAKIYPSRGTEEDETTDNFTIPVTLPFLETLHLFFPTRNVGSCFGRLALPKLRKLQMSLDVDDGEWSAATSAVFSQFQDRSPNIEHFAITLCDLSPDALHSILLHSPNLADLCLECCRYCVDDHLLEQMQRHEEDQAHLVPRLERLLVWDVDDSWTEERLLAMIKSRWWTTEELQALPAPPPVAPLQRVGISRIHSDPPFSESFLQEISRLRARGLDVKII
ncbi:F-box domain-containing protein [Favolaschia claudopus]|uniref:F-box domain-containing protein n=1 Tax=Favolaschia claudopus TaxID=2862362 RepID=A0AAW0AF80_9AGAR